MRKEDLPWPQIMGFCLILFIASMGMFVISATLFLCHPVGECRLVLPPAEAP